MLGIRNLYTIFIRQKIPAILFIYHKINNLNLSNSSVTLFFAIKMSKGKLYLKKNKSLKNSRWFPCIRRILTLLGDDQSLQLKEFTVVQRNASLVHSSNKKQQHVNIVYIGIITIKNLKGGGGVRHPQNLTPTQICGNLLPIQKCYVRRSLGCRTY